MRRDTVIAGVSGLASGVVWALGFAVVYYQLYRLSGAPQSVPPLLGPLSVMLVSATFGALGALPARKAARVSIQRTAGVHIGAILAVVICIAGFSAGGEGVVQQLLSYGFWAFIAGAGVVLVLVSLGTQQGARADGGTRGGLA